MFSEIILTPKVVAYSIINFVFRCSFIQSSVFISSIVLCNIFSKMGKDWRYGQKSRRKLFVPKKKPKHNLANLNSKKCVTVVPDNYQQVRYDFYMYTIHVFNFFNSLMIILLPIRIY